MKNLALFSLLLLFSCLSRQPDEGQPDRYSHIQDIQARTIIKTAIEHAGGIEKWESIRRLSYTKDFKLLFESGATEMDYQQVHDYHYQPLRVDIRSTENGSLVRTVLDEETYRRTKDGAPVNMSQEALENAVNTSLYVVSMPFNLLDPGAIIRYLGEDTLFNGQAVEVLQVSYDSQLDKDHSTSEIWRYYFDRADGRIVANWVKSRDHTSLIENLSYQRVNGILFHEKRQSFRVDSLGNKRYLRATYLYDNFQLE